MSFPLRLRGRSALLIHYGFLAGMGIKALDGALELMAGIVLLFVSVPQIDKWVIHITSSELSEDPQDFFAQMLRHGAAHFSVEAKRLATIYLLIEGVVKLLLVLGLVRGLRWSYPVGLGLLGLFCIYQGLRLVQVFSPVLAVLAFINLAVMVLIAVEWRLQSRLGL